jgi:hypothetical protein
VSIQKEKRVKLNGRTCEIVLRKARSGKLFVRVGEILRVPQVSGQTVLLLDYDTERKPRIRGIKQRLSVAHVQYLRSECHRSPSGHGWHCLVYVRGRWSRFQRIALQAMLESDPDREAQNFYRAQIFTEKEWTERGNVLFTNQKGW